MPLKQIPHLYTEYQKYNNGKNCKVFLSLIAIKRMLNSDSRWTCFEAKFEKLMDEYKDVVILSYMGFPEEWKKVLSH
jgi:abortive infection bacteriophage resistance protein